MQIKFVGPAMIQITIYDTNLLTLLCFTYKMMMIYYIYYKLYKTTASLPDFSRRTLKSSPLFWIFSTLSSSSLLSIKGEMWTLVLWKPNHIRRLLHHIRAQLFERWLALNPGLNLNWVSFSCFQSIFLDNFLCDFQSFQSSTCIQKELKMKCFLSFQIWIHSHTNPGLS